MFSCYPASPPPFSYHHHFSLTLLFIRTGDTGSSSAGIPTRTGIPSEGFSVTGTTSGPHASMTGTMCFSRQTRRSFNLRCSSLFSPIATTWSTWWTITTSSGPRYHDCPPFLSPSLLACLLGRCLFSSVIIAPLSISNVALELQLTPPLSISLSPRRFPLAWFKARAQEMEEHPGFQGDPSPLSGRFC